MVRPGKDRWQELLQGQRIWRAESTSYTGLMEFASSVASPLRAMENARMIVLLVKSEPFHGRLWVTEVEVVEVASWVFDLPAGNVKSAASPGHPEKS